MVFKSKQNNPQPSTGYVRLLVINIPKIDEAKAALQAKLENNANPKQEAQIVASPAVRRYPDSDKISSCKNISAGSSIEGRLTFTVTQAQGDAEAGQGQNKIEIKVKDERRCKKSKISNVAKAKSATGSAYNRAKTGAKELGQKAKAKASSAWDSTKKAASSAKTKVSSAASSAKASVTKRFGSK